MRSTPNVKAERHRIDGPGNTNCGFFRIEQTSGDLRIQVSDGGGWDHVSVSLSKRCPTWEEMSLVKDLFFRDDEAVMQLHPPKSNYVNCHPYCLHLWRPQTADEIAAVRADWGDEWPYGDLPSPGEIPLPDSVMVGPKGVTA